VRLGSGRWTGTVLAVLLAGCALAGCGRSGSVLVDSSTTTPVPTVTATTRPAATAAPTTRGIPSTTGKVPVTTAQAGPAGQALTFRGMTIQLRASWRAAGTGDEVTVTAGRACRRSPGRVDCPGFLLLGPTQIAIADELGPYDPERVWHPGTGVEGCPEDRDGLAEQTPTRPRKGGLAKVGAKDATYREWRVTCVDARTGKPESAYTQRVWHLKAAGILVVDEWSTPGLDQVLAEATFG
jgi:hypothetical protein